MALNNTAPTTYTTSVLIGDTVATTGSSNDGLPIMSVDGNGNTISAALELQSTEGGFVPPRMTSTQIAAIDVPIAGMQAFNSTLKSPVTYVNGAFNGQLLLASVTLTQAQVIGMSVTPVQIIAAPGAGYRIFVVQATFINNFVTTAFATGGVGVLQYANTAAGGGTNALANTIPANFFTAGASTGYSNNQPAGTLNANFTGLSNTGIYLSNQTGAFTAGNVASTIVVNVVYYILPAAI